MRIGRKEALLALVAGIVPWLTHRAGAQDPLPLRPREPAVRTPVQSAELAELQRRVSALEAQLANQVAFSKDASGNLRLHGGGNITLEASSNLTIKALGQLQALGSGLTKITGSTIALN